MLKAAQEAKPDLVNWLRLKLKVTRKTLESLSNYIHPTDQGRIVSMQALDNVDGILTAQDSVDGVRSDESEVNEGALAAEGAQ